MSIWDYAPKGGLWTGVVVGVGLVAAPVVIPWVWSGVGTLLQAVVKGSFMVYEKAHEFGAEMVEAAEDLFEEAKSEAHRELAAARENK